MSHDLIENWRPEQYENHLDHKAFDEITCSLIFTKKNKLFG